MIHAVYLPLGYLIGSINPAYIISRLKGFDIRRKGTGNAGATNLGLQLGVWYGIITMLFDMLKAFIATYLPKKLTGSTILAAAAGIACIIGHIFPFYMGFRGGKGTACIMGFGLGLRPSFLIPIGLASFMLSRFAGASTLAPVFAAMIMSAYYIFFEKAIGMALLMILLVAVLLIPRKRDIALLKSTARSSQDMPLWASPFKLGELYKMYFKDKHENAVQVEMRTVMLEEYQETENGIR